MRTILSGLMLVIASAQGAPVTGGIGYKVNVVPFTTTLTAVAEDDIPEWAKLPGEQGWYEFELGILQSNANGILLMQRGLLLTDPSTVFPVLSSIQLQPGGLSWPTWYPPNESDNPEPASILLVAIGLAALARLRTAHSVQKLLNQANETGSNGTL